MPSRISADEFTNSNSNGAPSFVNGLSIPVGTGITGPGAINISGVATAGSFSGNVTGNVNSTGVSTFTTLKVGTGVTINSGIVSASYFYGDGTNIINIGGALTVNSYSPAIGATNVNSSPAVVLTFNKGIIRGTGNILVRSDSNTGTILETIPVSNTTKVSINNEVATLSLDSVSFGTTCYVVIPSGAFKDTYSTGSISSITNYYFTIQESSPIIKTVFSWGYNNQGELGLGDETRRSSPTQLPGNQWSDFYHCRHNTIGIRDDGTLWGWGHNSNGELGQSTTIRYDSPVQIPGTQWLDLPVKSGGADSIYHVFARKSDGTIWGWGHNNFGELGLNNTTRYSSPVILFGGDTDWYDLSSSHYGTVGIKSDSTLWAWGRNNEGQLGQNNTIQRSSPVQIPGTTWNNVRGGNRHYFATKTDNTLWSWGHNAYGQLGQNNITPRSSPVQIPGTQWSCEYKKGAANYHSGLMIKSDSTLWTWGHNPHGELGTNNTTQRSSPAQVPGGNWIKISGSGHSSAAIRTGDQLWTWGHNNYGQLGQNNATTYVSPVQVPGTTWSDVWNGGHQGGVMVGMQTSL